jgi:hypothetical protein
MELVLMARQRLAFLFGWGLFMLFAQIPILLIGSAFNYEPHVIGISEVIAAILTVMFTTIMLVREDM